MLCAVCSEEYAEELNECPRCRAAEPALEVAPHEVPDLQEADVHLAVPQADAPDMTDNSNVSTRSAQAPNNSTLIEFPGVNRNRPAWRKELSERFREIQQKRAREADLDVTPEPSPDAALPALTHEEARAVAANRAAESASKQLGLVPPPDEPELNPLVAAALRRIERARANVPAQPVARQGSGRGQAATAAARVVEEQPVQTPEPVAPPPLVVVQPKPAAKVEVATAKVEQVEEPEGDAPSSAGLRAGATQPVKSQAPATQAPAADETTATVVETTSRQEVVTASRQKVTHVAAQASATFEAQAEASAADEADDAEYASRQPRHLSGVLDEFWLERQGIELLPKVEEKELTYDDRAPRTKRIAAAVIDLLAVAFLSAPFAAAIELTISNWNDPRVSGSMALIAALVMFLYHTCSLALAGRTLGMSLCGLHAVDASKASVPTTGQSMRRAVVYTLSLATLGLGLLYSLFDAEGRTVHDLLSGTVVVKK